MAGPAGRRRAGGTGPRVADAHRAHPPTGRTLRHAAAAAHRRSGDARRPRGRTPQENGSGMEVKPGYKQTEVGVIPKEWNAVSFSEILEFRNGANADKEAYGKGVPFVNVLEVITKGPLKSSDIPGRVLLTKSAIESYSVRLGDLVFNRTSETDNELALTAVYMDDKPVVFGGFVIRS